MLTTLNIKKIIYGSFVVFVILYCLNAFLSPVDSEALVKYSITELQLRLIVLTLLLPIIGIWACAAYGFVHFKQYALSIKGSAAGKGTNTIANGLGIIALQLTVSGAVSLATSIASIKNALGGERGETILSTSLSVTITLVAAIVLYRGASQLNASLRQSSKPHALTRSIYAILLASAVFLVVIVLRHPGSESTSSGSIYDYISLSAAILGIWIPYIIAWNFFLLAARNLYHYGVKAEGKVYKQTFSLLTTGIYIILASSVLIQLLGAFGGAFSNVRLVPLLLIIYGLLVSLGLGYVCIARAANRLRHVEH